MTNEELAKYLFELEGRVIKLETAAKAVPPRSASSAMAPPVDLDSDRGNFVIKYPPKQWKGADFTGKRLSETSPEFCDAVAGLKEWCAKRDRDAGDAKKESWSLHDLQAARGWAERLGSGWKPVAKVNDFSEEIPF